MTLPNQRFRGRFAAMCARAVVPCVAVFLVACSFEPPADVPDDDDDTAMHDAAPPDMMPVECEAGTITCDDAEERYVECGPDGLSVRVADCPMGCATDVEKCLDVDPSNDLGAYLDIARTDATVPSVAFTGSSTIDTVTGNVTNNGATVQLPSNLIGDDMRVFLLKELQVAGTLKITGDKHSIAFVVDGDVTITGTIDVSGDGPTPGPGAVLRADTCNGTGSGALELSNSGAGGAGHYDGGANGGYGNGSSTLLAGGAQFRDDDLEPLVAGCSGGSKLELINNQSQLSRGGGGGGALQISSSSRVTISGVGKIDASGGGGHANGQFVIPGAGGGSGGSVLLEAPEIVLDGPGVVVSTRGGGGSSSGTDAATRDGADGGTDTTPAPGGTDSPYASGGSGGTESAAPAAGSNGPSSSYPEGGGGGGAVGEARFNTRSGTLTPTNGATIRSRFSEDTVGTRVFP
jgi:hypothetical protein